MAERNSETTARTLGGALQNLLVSGIRISVAVNLYALEQIQKTIEETRGHGLPAATERVVTALNTLSDSLENGIDTTKKEALRSVGRVAAKAAEKYFAIFSPAAILQALHDSRPKDAGPAASSASPETAAANAPHLAVDILTGPPEA